LQVKQTRLDGLRAGVNRQHIWCSMFTLAHLDSP
jgi:hypothetical protein